MQNSLADRIDDYVDDLFPQMVGVRRWLHSHPELSGREYETTRYLQELIEQHGLTARIGPDQRGLVVDSTDGPAPSGRGIIALRADIDALPVLDTKQVEYRSSHRGIMHACGHDAHTATVVGALLALKRATGNGILQSPVNWRGIFQPAEESNLGALEMISAGALEGVAAIIGLHVDPSRQTGKVGIRTGALTASCDEMHILVEGRGGHGARPHECLDPIAVAAQLVSSIYLFVPRANDSQDPTVVNVCHIHGGENANVIPGEVRLEGTLRTLTDSVRRRTKEHIQQLARGLAEASGAKIDIRFVPGPPGVINDVRLTEAIRTCASDLLGEENVEKIVRPSMGGEDFAHYLSRVPGAMFRLGSRQSGRSDVTLLHSPTFDIDEEALRIGAKLLARVVLNWSRAQN